ncbi:MAG: hypothetical protein JNK82_43770 [Myxococcaceae bacterium]|nr:hypothetical protein [Myxococcaceae bacterium]
MTDNKFGAEFFKKTADEVFGLQAKWVEQSFKAMDEYNTLVKANVKYWADLQADARKLVTDALS